MSLTLEDSTTYQLILERGIAQGIPLGVAQGRTEEAQATILRLGAKRFGPPQPDLEAAVRTIADRERLERITDRVFEATTWADLLSTP
jgi:Domain of unknown function (DUF4351)